MAKKAEINEKASSLLFEVQGVKIYKDKIYKVIDRPDEEAPDGLKESGMSKIPFLGNSNIIRCSWDNMTGAYDTGFYTNSKCYRGVSRDRIKEMVQQRKANIMEPYAQQNNTVLTQDNVAFWDDFSVKLESDETFFDTGNVVDVLKLYIALMSGFLAPKENEGDPFFMMAQHRLVNDEDDVNFEAEKKLSFVEATTEFTNMIKDEHQKAVDIAIYLGIVNDVSVADKYLNLAFIKYLEGSYQNIGTYNRTRAMYNSEETRIVIKMTRIIKALIRQGLLNLGKEGIIYKGIILGRTEKEAAEKICTETYVSDRMVLIEEYDRIFGKKEE